MSDIFWVGVFQETICKILSDKLAYCIRPSGGMADAGDLKSPARKGVWVRLPPRPPNELILAATDVRPGNSGDTYGRK